MIGHRSETRGLRFLLIFESSGRKVVGGLGDVRVWDYGLRAEGSWSVGALRFRALEGA